MVRKHGIASPQQGEAMPWSRDMTFKRFEPEVAGRNVADRHSLPFAAWEERP